MEYLKNFIAYNTAGITLSGISFVSLEYMSDPSNFKKNMKTYANNVKYWVLDKIVTGYTLYRDYFPEEKNTQDNTTNIDSLTYNVEGDLISKDSPEYKWSFERELIDGEEYFVRDHFIKTQHRIKTNNIFMGCEIINDGNTIDITSEISKFCVVGISIDRIFLKAFMKKFFSIDLCDDFTMNFISKDCKVSSLDKTQKLCINNNNFEISHHLKVNLDE